MITPKIQDVQTSRIKFRPGDRILVRTSSILNQNERKKLSRSVEQFVGEHVRVLVIDCLTTTLIRTRGTDDLFLASAKDSGGITNLPGTANVQCSVADIQCGDKLTVIVQNYHRSIRHVVEEWAGQDVEVRIISGNLNDRS